ncbi:MAG: proline--tRNA ligase, partial [Candidatus Pacearchaeota archaeon]|nr:proline--tRNA ligase [Candidatus Pacearchaeota archaeon]
VKGTMIIKPYGYAIWQKIQDYFNSVISKIGVKNAYFPMFIPESFFKKEAEHASGFQAEVAWVQGDEKSERFAIRPTSETIIYDSFSRWIRSWRDLPFRINQWCNVVRWEVSQCKLFLRSREFLWQEGHCVYETEKECDKEVLMILEEYEKLCKSLLAIPSIKGRKSDKEKFAGAYYTTTIETFTQEGKALQLGTSHNLGQGFAKSFNISFLDKDKKPTLPWQSSWGFSTRLIGALVMTHADNKGLVLPPKIAPTQIIIVPIFNEKNKSKVLKEAEKIKSSLSYYSIEIDSREDYSPGWKFNESELKGIPLRIEIGERDLEKDSVTLARRDTCEKEQVKISQLAKKIPLLLDDIQDKLYDKAKKFLNSSIEEVKNFQEFREAVKNKKLVLANFCGEKQCEDWIKDKSGGAGSRCIPFKQEAKGKCIYCNKPAKFKAYFAKSY